MIRNLRRQIGVATPPTWALDVYDRTRVHDVNGYYARLGLIDRGTVRVDLTCADIAKIARRRLYDYHPDRGNFDPVQWQSISVARACLIDGPRRCIYDSLPSNMRMLDEDVKAQVTLDLTQPPMYDDPDKPTYYYEGEDPGEWYARLWITVLSYAYWSIGAIDNVRVALADRWGYENYNWGDILYVNRDELDWDKVAYFVAKQFCGEQWYLAYCRTAVTGGYAFRAILAQFADPLKQ